MITNNFLFFQSPYLGKQIYVKLIISIGHLHLFDTSMNIEAKNYTGPYLPKDRSYKRMPLDHFRFNLAKSIMFPLGQIVGDPERVQLSVVLSSLPLHPIYVIDLMIYPSKAASLLR